MDYREKVFREADPLKQLMLKIPGFSGYYNKEMRRDADKMLRDHLAGQFAAQRARLNSIQNDLIRAKAYDMIGRIDKAITKLQTLIDRIRTATYGYAGLFDAARVDEAALDRLYQFDASLASGVDRLSGMVTNLENVTRQKAVEESAIDNAIDALVDETENLNATFDKRRQAIQGQM